MVAQSNEVPNNETSYKTPLNFTACLEEASKAFGCEYSHYICSYSTLRKSIPADHLENQVSISNIVSNYGKLTGALAGMHQTQGPSAKFVAALDAELRRIVQLMSTLFDTLMLQLYDEYHILRLFDVNTMDIKIVKKGNRMEMLGERLKCFDHFRKWNTYAFRRLAMKFDEFVERALKREKQATTVWMGARLKETLDLLNLEGGLVLYSMCHHLRRRHLNLKSSDAMCLKSNEKFLDGIVGESVLGGSMCDHEDLIKLAADTGIKLGPHMLLDRKKQDPVEYNLGGGSPLIPSHDEPQLQHSGLEEPSPRSSPHSQSSPRQFSIDRESNAAGVADHLLHTAEASEIGPLGGPSTAPPLEFDNEDDDDGSSEHDVADETTLSSNTNSDKSLPTVLVEDLENEDHMQLSQHCSDENQRIISTDADMNTIPTTNNYLTLSKEALSNLSSPKNMDSMSVSPSASIGDPKDQCILSAEEGSIVRMHGEEGDEHGHNKKFNRTTRRLLVPPEDNMNVKVVLCRYLAMLNFTVELQVLRYYKLLVNIKEKVEREGSLKSEESSLSKAVAVSKGFLKPSKGLSSCAMKKRNIHMAFLDSENLQGYRDLLADSNYRLRVSKQKDEVLLTPRAGTSIGGGVTGTGGGNPVVNINNQTQNHLSLTPESMKLSPNYGGGKGTAPVGTNFGSGQPEDRKKKFRDKARLWRLRWSNDWQYNAEKIVIVERIDYADADSKSRNTSNQNAYSDCPGGTFRDPSCPGTGEQSIPTMEEMVEEGVYGIALESRDLKSLMSNPQDFNTARCAEYYAKEYGKRLPNEDIITHFKKVTDSLRKAVLNYNIRPVLQTWGKRDMFVFTDPYRDQQLFPSELPEELDLHKRSDWSHAADISSNSLVMIDEDVAYVDQYETYFGKEFTTPTSAESKRKVKISKEPILTPSDAAKKHAIWSFPLIVVRIHGREERCSRVASLINHISLRAAEVYGLSSYAHGIAQLVAPKVNSFLEASKSKDQLNFPSWMSFTEIIQTAEANLCRQMKDRKTILRNTVKQNRRSSNEVDECSVDTTSNPSSSSIDVEDDEDDTAPNQDEMFERDGDEVLERKFQSQTLIESPPDTDTIILTHPQEVKNAVNVESIDEYSEADKSYAALLGRAVVNAPLEDQFVHPKKDDLFVLKVPKFDEVDRDLWTDFNSCREEIMENCMPIDAKIDPDKSPTIVAAFDSNAQGLNQPLLKIRDQRSARPASGGFFRKWTQRILSLMGGGSDAPNGAGNNNAQQLQQNSHNVIVRVEPKAFFANERTLLQWMNICVLLSTIAITLLSLEGRTAMFAGLILAPIAIFFLLYSFVTYRKRNRALTNREPIKYADETGPFLLVCSLVFSLTVILFVNIREHAAGNKSNASLLHQISQRSSMIK